MGWTWPRHLAEWPHGLRGDEKQVVKMQHRSAWACIARRGVGGAGHPILLQQQMQSQRAGAADERRSAIAGSLEKMRGAA